MGKFDKKEVCEYCNEKMEAKYRSKRFCSPKCRVYWNREIKNKKHQNIIKKELEKPKEKTDLTFWEKMRNKKFGI